jgi:endonuclease/exonuclease/phosphatase (EEP) superfamily protein YafD
VFLFGPRWPILAPLLLLVPLGLVFRRHVLPWLCGALLIAVGPFMGLELPWQRVSHFFAAPADLQLRVVTYNCGGTEDQAIVQMAQALQPDVLTLNEWHPARPLPAALSNGRYLAHIGGNLIISRFPLEAIEELRSDLLRPWDYRAVRCRLQTPVGLAQVVCVHLETPRHGLAEVQHSLWRGAAEMRRTTDKRQWEAELASRFASEFSGPSIVAGDFNTPVESRIYQRCWSRWQNAYSEAGCGWGNTKFTRFFGVRIDHVLVSSQWRVDSAWVGPDLGGDHRPLVAELALRL